MKKLQPSTDELMARTTQNWELLKRGSKKKAINKSAEEYVAETARQKSQMDRLIADWTRDGHGHIDFKKAEGVIRFLWENFNSLCILTDERNLTKVRYLDALRKRYKIDFLAGCESQTNWYQVPDGFGFSDLIGLGEDKRCVAAHNIHDTTCCQPGGTLAAVYGRATAFGAVKTG